MPAFAWAAGRYLPLTALQYQIVVLFASLPTASSAYILAVRMGGNGPMVAATISLDDQSRPSSPRRSGWRWSARARGRGGGTWAQRRSRYVSRTSGAGGVRGGSAGAARMRAASAWAPAPSAAVAWRRLLPRPHGEVAQPAFMADAADRAAFEPLVELGLGPAGTGRPCRARRSHCARRNRAAWPGARTCSTGRPAGSRRNHRRGCPSGRGIPLESAPCARWSGRRCSAGRVEAVRLQDGGGGADVDAAAAVAAVGASGGSAGRGRSTRISPRKNIEPPSRSSSSVCLPRQPSPAWLGQGATSITGAESVNTRYPNGPTRCRSMRDASCCSRSRSTLR